MGEAKLPTQTLPVHELMTASKLSSPLRDGIRRLLTNDWFIVISLALIAAAVRWLFVLLSSSVWMGS